MGGLGVVSLRVGTRTLNPKQQSAILIPRSFVFIDILALLSQEQPSAVSRILAIFGFGVQESRSREANSHLRDCG